MTDTQRIHDVEARYDEAWNAGDLDALLSCIHDDAVLWNPRDDVAAGADEIREVLGAFLSGDGKDSTHASTIRRVEFATSDVAVVDGVAVLEGPALGRFEHAYTDILVRRDGDWRIAHIRAYATR